jgi:hypothetical protein
LLGVDGAGRVDDVALADHIAGGHLPAIIIVADRTP